MDLLEKRVTISVEIIDRSGLSITNTPPATTWLLASKIPKLRKSVPGLKKATNPLSSDQAQTCWFLLKIMDRGPLDRLDKASYVGRVAIVPIQSHSPCSAHCGLLYT